MSKRVTLRTVADLAEVSVGAVSQVLSNPDHPRFSADTRTRILAAAKQAGYRPNRFARALREGRSNLIFLMAPRLNPEFMENLERLIREAGLQLMVRFTPNRAAEAEAEGLRTAVDWQADGIIWFPRGHEGDYASAVERVRSTETPVVLLHRSLTDLPDADVVRHDLASSARTLVEHLASRGYKEIVYLTAGHTAGDDKGRLNLLRQSAKRAGVHVKSADVRNDDKTADRVRKTVTGASLPAALVCEGDWLAADAVSAVEKLALNCPRDVGVVTIGDYLVDGRLRAPVLTRPKLTAVREAFGDLARHAVSILQARISGQYDSLIRETLESEELIVRESTSRGRS